MIQIDDFRQITIFSCRVFLCRCHRRSALPIRDHLPNSGRSQPTSAGPYH